MQVQSKGHHLLLYQPVPVVSVLDREMQWIKIRWRENPLGSIHTIKKINTLSPPPPPYHPLLHHQLFHSLLLAICAHSLALESSSCALLCLPLSLCLDLPSPPLPSLSVPSTLPTFPPLLSLSLSPSLQLSLSLSPSCNAPSLTSDPEGASPTIAFIFLFLVGSRCGCWLPAGSLALP